MKTTSLLLFLVLAINTFASLPPEKPLYPQGAVLKPYTLPYEEVSVDSMVHPKSVTGLNRVFSYVTQPTYMLFPAKEENNKHIGLVIFPGGGLKNIWLDKEGTDIALWLSNQGITCMVVKYRTNVIDPKGKWTLEYDKYKDAVYSDAKTSMQIMKKMADSLNFNKTKIGMMGFSAGGWLAEGVVYKYYNKNQDWFPNYVALIYHGNYVKKINDVKDKENLPPFFMTISKNDNKLPYKKVIKYLQKVSQEVKGSQLNIYNDGGHGFGLAYDENMEVTTWKDEFVKWVIDN